MKGMFALRLVLALSAIPLGGGFAVAQAPGVAPGIGPGGPGFGEHRPPMERAFRFDGMHGQFWNNPKIVEKLQLTEEQRKDMDQAWLEQREKLVDLKGSVDKAEIEMEPLMKADQPNESAILAQIDKIAAARAELEKANARFLLAIRAKLTPDQWKQVREFREHQMPQGQWGRGGPNSRLRGPGQLQPQRQDGGSQSAPPPAPPQGGPLGDEE